MIQEIDMAKRLSLEEYLKKQSKRNPASEEKKKSAVKRKPVFKDDEKVYGKSKKLYKNKPDREHFDPGHPGRLGLDSEAKDRQRALDKRRIKAQEDLVKSRRLEAKTKLINDALEIQKGMQEIQQAALNTFQMEERAALNKTLIDQEINEIIGAGKAQAGIERAKGETAAEMDSLNLAAQGQRLSGTGAKAVTQSSKLLAATRAADAQSHALSRALGLEYEKVAIERQVDYSNIQKSIAKHSGLSRIAFGIADAAVRFREGYPWGEAEQRPDVPKNAVTDNRGLLKGQRYA